MKTRLLMTTLMLALYMTVALSQNYKQLQLFVGSGGGSSSSSSFQMNTTIGEPATGSSSSASYEQGMGFWPVYEAFREFYSTSLFVADGWNMVSLPRNVSNHSKSFLFPSAVSNAFRYQGSYVQSDSIVNSIGYWLKFSGGQTLALGGLPRGQETVYVADKWNLIGSISNTVPVGSVVQEPGGIVVSQYFGYNNGYFNASTIEPGKAYWVKTNGGGKLILSSSGSAAPVNGPTASFSDLNVLTIKPQVVKAKRRGVFQQKLYFGKQLSKEQAPELYDLPPIPPPEAMDARFASNRFVEFIPNNLSEPMEIPVRLQANEQRLKLDWKMAELSGLRYFLVEKKGKEVVARHRLINSGSTMIDLQAERTYTLLVEQVPSIFALHQNYPNPFNPSTTIRFDLPEPSHVRLTVYDLLGREVTTRFHDEVMDEGQHAVTFDAQNYASGVYFFRLYAKAVTSGKVFQDVKKMMLVK